MGKTFKVTVNDSFDLEITKNEIKKIDAIQTDNNTFHVIDKNQSLEATIENSDFQNKKYTVAIGNNSYNVAITDDLAILIKEMGLSLGTTKQVNSIKAPMPGLIIDINVEVGQEIKENEALIIVEAMKMENALAAPRDGIIKNISVAKGDTVDKGALLIELE